MSYDINTYWSSLAYSAGNLKNPIYKWSCFSNASTTELSGYIQDITEQLESYDISNAIYQYDENRDAHYKTKAPIETKIFATLSDARLSTDALTIGTSLSGPNTPLKSALMT